MMEVALGTQAVQDFLIHLEMSLLQDDDLVPLIDMAVNQARSGAGEAIGLAGGFLLTPVDSLDAAIVDAGGRVIPGLTVDFGLLEMSPGAAAAVADRIASGLDSGADDLGLAEIVTGGGSEVLVEIVTASYTERFTHVGLGDASSLDLSFLAAPSGRIISVHLFGQTLPGDPTVEEELSPRELFAYRWNQGLVRMLGDDGVALVRTEAALERSRAQEARLPPNATVVLAAGVGVPGVVAVEEDGTDDGEITLERRQELKAFAAAEARVRGFQTGWAIADALTTDAADAWNEYAEGNRQSQFQTHIDPEGVIPMHCLAHIDPDETGGLEVVGVGRINDQGECVEPVAVPAEAYKSLIGLYVMYDHCVRTARMLRRLNEPGSTGPLDPSATPTTVDPFFVPPDDPNDPLKCERPRRPARLGGGTMGDVHMVTFDRLIYENQAAGEFLVFDSGTAAIQARTEPWPLSDVASVVTAVAVRIGDVAISMHEGGGTWVAGEKVELERGLPVSVGGASLLWTGSAWIVVWPDGTEVYVRDNQEDNGTMHFIVYPVGSAWVGMLGNGNDDPSDDLLTRVGDPYPRGEIADFERFYATFIDSWRISEDESLFHYGEGESTAAFQLDDFPVFWVDFDDLDQTAKSEADALCREGGITREDLLVACTYDLVVTGDRGFVYDAFVFQETFPDPPRLALPPGGNIITVGDFTFEFGGFADNGWCTVDELSFAAAVVSTDGFGRRVDVSIQYVASSDPMVSVVMLREGSPHAWVVTHLDPPTGTVEQADYDGSQLTLEGTAFLNDPFDVDLAPNLPLPPGKLLHPFHLQAACDR
jgi:hypothetical protein